MNFGGKSRKWWEISHKKKTSNNNNSKWRYLTTLSLAVDDKVLKKVASHFRLAENITKVSHALALHFEKNFRVRLMCLWASLSTTSTTNISFGKLGALYTLFKPNSLVLKWFKCQTFNVLNAWYQGMLTLK